ncbi:MAG: ATP-binding protein [Synergistaceae bacterium]|jgi:predicted AAA+ superfamily ATPase|nr:ATP-binding protein [Synergistaceae bacterium]
MYLERIYEKTVLESLKNFPVTAIVGPRQCGKSTLAQHAALNYEKRIYLDLERPSDLARLENAEWFLSSQRDKLICLDEVQRMPELFPLIRSLTDEWDKPGAFLLLGSASRDLLKQSSESLAGRIRYVRIAPFIWSELQGQKGVTLEKYLSRGGFPRSMLAEDDVSYEWRQSFISTFLERDLREWAGFAPLAMRRLWQMLAHHNGQTVNYSSLASSLDISAVSVKNYVDLLAGTFMLEVIPPWMSNIGKRLVKTPKIYLPDSGLLSTLLGLRSFEEIMGYPGFGALWEQTVLVNIRCLFPDAEIFHYRTSNGAECDFVVKLRNKIFAVECKSSPAPKLSRGNYGAFGDISPERTFIVVPTGSSWPMKPGIDVVVIGDLKTGIDSCFHRGG